MIELALVIKGATLGLSVAKYTGIIQDKLKLQVDKLAGSELEAGLRALEQAAHSEREQQFLLRESRNRFNKAISIEEGFRLAAAHLGLALCHSSLGDATNAERAIRGLVEVKPPRPSSLLLAGRALNKAPAWALVAGAVCFPFALVVSPHVAAAKLMAPTAEQLLARHEEAVEGFVSLQQSATALLEKSLRDGCECVFGLADVPAETV